jgi:hypothetical protein
MRAHEFDDRLALIHQYSRRSNVIGRLNIGDYTIFLDEHLMIQAKLPERDVDEFVIQEVVPKIPKAKAKWKTLGPGQSFWLYDNTNRIALGVKILNLEFKIFLVKTVWRGMPQSNAKYPIFNVV